MIAGIVNSATLNSAILHRKNFTYSFSLNLMMAAILNSAILDSAILHKKNFSHSLWLNLMIVSPSWILPCWIQTLPSWIQTPCYLLSDSLKDTLTPLWLWLKIIQSDYLDDGSHLEFNHFAKKKLYSFILIQLDEGSHLEFCHPGFSHFAQKKIHSFILTQLDYGSHLEFCHVGFRHCHLGFRHLVIFSQIHSKTLSLHSDFDSN